MSLLADVVDDMAVLLTKLEMTGWKVARGREGRPVPALVTQVVTPARTEFSAWDLGVGRLGGFPGGVADRAAGGEGVPAQGDGDLDRPDGDLAARLATIADPRFAGQVIALHGDPVAFAHRRCRMRGHHPERDDLEVPGQPLTAAATRRQIDGDPQFAAGLAVTGAEGPGVIGQVPGDGDSDHVNLPGGVPGGAAAPLAA